MHRSWPIGMALLAMTWLAASCASRPKVDWDAISWDSRIGNYTYAQALEELGPPAARSQSNEGTSAEWIIKRRSNVSFGFGMGVGSYGSHTATHTGVGTSVTPRGGDQFMRLDFDPSGQLTRWERIWR